MARSNGPFGPQGTRAPLRGHAADDPFAAPPAGQPPGQWGGQPTQPGQGYHFPPEPEANYGFNQSQPQWGQQPDPGGYDLGTYMPNGGQPYAPGPAPFPQVAQGHYGPAQQAYAGPDPEYDDEFIDDDQPRRGRRMMLIAAAMVGAIGVGGALAYTYKSFIAPSSGRVPLVRAGDSNVKVKPENRGGREFANTDKKMLSRLGDDAPQKEADAQDDRTGDDSGPKRVRTIPITPGAGPPAAAPPSVPGIMLENVGPRAPRAAPQPPPQRVTIGQPPPPPPAQAEDRQPTAARRAVVVEPPPPPPAAKPAPQAKVKEAAAAPSPPPAVNTTGAGYVAVLSSQKSRMQALKIFADLQQKYGDVLGGKTPDVQEADLSARGMGTMYRLVVGPPGSREAASGICNQLKTAGHPDCWVKEY